MGEATRPAVSTADAIRNALRTVLDPDLHRDIVSLDMVKEITVCGAAAKIKIELTTPACPLKDKIGADIRAAVARDVPEITEVGIDWGARVTSSLSGPLITGVKNIVAVGSGKGGVGKSTVAANLAVGLAQTGATVGLLDADIYGPSMPIMLGVRKPELTVANEKINPVVAHGVRVMSMGFLVGEEKPIIWRGAMVHKAIQQCLRDVNWGDLDYLFVDMPPGTGDVQLTLVQSVALTGAVIVTTPQDVGLTISLKTLLMFRQTNTHILGVIENMSYYVCPTCGDRAAIFGHGQAREAARSAGAPFLGEIPLDLKIREASDAGRPVVLAGDEVPVARAYSEIVRALAAQISIRNASGVKPQRLEVDPLAVLKKG